MSFVRRNISQRLLSKEVQLLSNFITAISGPNNLCNSWVVAKPETGRNAYGNYPISVIIGSLPNGPGWR